MVIRIDVNIIIFRHNHYSSTDWEWIDYDQDTAKGRKNCEKYCKEWDPAVALSKLPVPENLTSDVECVQCEWRGTVDETNDNDGEMVCPECGEPVEFYEPIVINTNPWIDVKVTPAVEGQYEVKNTHTPVWPFPAWFEATWNGKAWVDSEGKPVENVVEWREL